MLGFLGERRAWWAAVLIALLLLTTLFWGFSGATERVSSMIGQRVGLETKIDDLSLSFGGVEIAGLEMRGAQGGLLVRVERMKAQMNPVAALFNGTRSIRRLSARGVEVTLDLRQHGLSDALALLRKKIAGPATTATRPTQSGRAAQSGRAYEIADLNVEVIDADGQLALFRNASVDKESDELRCSIEETRIGAREADHAYSGPTVLVLRRNEGAWNLQELDVHEATVRSVRQGEGPRRALARRVTQALALLRPTSTAKDEAESTARPGSSVGLVVAAPAAQARLFDRLSPDADITVSDVQVESRISAGRVERLRDFELRLLGDDRGSYRITVRGETTHEGRLRVDVAITPAEARAEGSIALRRISLALLAPFVPDFPIYDAEAGTLDAELSLDAESAERVRIEGMLKLRELGLASERIAPEPVEHIDLDLGGKGVWHPRERRLAIERGQIRLGRAQVLVEGELERTVEHYRVDLTAKLPPTDCNDVVRAIPDDILGSLAEFEWSGNWSALGRISLDSRDLEATELSIRVRNLCTFVRTPQWVRVERFRQPFRHRVTEADGTTFEMRTGPGTDRWVALADVSPFVAPAIISHEDGAFYEHGGFAPWAIRDALVRNLQEGRYVVGASTISMQLAKNLYLQREKTIARKVQEVILTWWLENALTKDEILELYLNVIEYGPGVYGLQYAAAYYFGREPRDLSPAESAFLACMLPSPKGYHVSYERGELTRFMKNRMRRLLEHMAKRERIGPEALAYGLAELDDFRFHRVGDPLPPPRALPPLGTPEETHPEAFDPFEALFVDP